MNRQIWIAVGCMVLIAPVQAASFDCSIASTSQEKLICFDYRLSDLDSQLAWSYSEVLKQTKDPVALKQSQKDWVAAREKCTDVNCIIHAYVARIEAVSPGSKLEEVYFPKGKIPWDFSPKTGYQVTDYAKIKNNKLTFGTIANDATFSNGEDVIIPEDDNGLATTKAERETLISLVSSLHVNRNLEIKSSTGNNDLVKLGDMHLAYVDTSYGECVGGLGISGIYLARNVPWTKTNVLVQMRPSDWTPYRHQGTWVDPDCEESEPWLKINPNMMDAVVFNRSLFLQENHISHDYVLRLDHNLQTASLLLGKKIFLGWGSDLEALTGKACNKFVGSSILGDKSYSTKHRACIDNQLQKIIGEVNGFYH